MPDDNFPYEVTLIWSGERMSMLQVMSEVFNDKIPRAVYVKRKSKPAASSDECREKFEAWRGDNGKDRRSVEKRGDVYSMPSTFNGWIIWQAAWASREQADAIAFAREYKGEKE